ncbi:similar to Saccharomyces cerevisiae YJL035C TAD2 Subunit of tRNA-specific adenosine-34 deaminase, forms a heterodimer with Tad3p [Geotrichum candidum]|uniref:Similar to Saccharomyces cerevisiae YJL035C TAD2 Subunit of tRNA-specific adenosine-34 deaminase, forms a heterodimer with Tad3p n=1 Tax=Geotrichum candidum TaxID=1173061 RepID=A0A0J9XFE3_GEOCN|nr:similar to Saccharomyces cerevisiae YJL035C TAD2 Subunit of tRNA-specific adenosine-34 deaminase, forms a heterodimer with Tad3p [Geotrichum candidum]
MREALLEAEAALAINEVPVGCVFVHNDKIIGRGRNDTNRTSCATRHAEFLGIDEILSKYDKDIFKETDLYVTVEPCVMCASALRQLEIRKVYFGAANDRFGGCGSVLSLHNHAKLPEPAYNVYPGFYRDEAIVMLRKFYRA